MVCHSRKSTVQTEFRGIELISQINKTFVATVPVVVKRQASDCIVITEQFWRKNNIVLVYMLTL